MKEHPRGGVLRRRDLLALLQRLARPGATLVEVVRQHAHGALPDYAVIDRAQPDAPSVPVERALVETACARGWIGCVTGGSRTVVTRAGRELLRRAKADATLQATLATASLPRGGERSPFRNAMECPLAWLAVRRDAAGRPFIEPQELAAGERLRADLTYAGLGPRMTMSWSGMPSDRDAARASGRGLDLAEGVLAARQRVTRALSAVGPEFSGLLIDVCGHYRGLAEVASAEGWPQRAARLLLQQALRSLARHYGLLPRVPVEQTIAARLRHWGSDGYRPTLAPPSTGSNQDS